MLVFGAEYDKDTIYEIRIIKKGKFIYINKPYENDNKEFKMDLTNGQFYRINHYKTTGTKITPVNVKNITKWFANCSIFCDDEKFCKVIHYNKINGYFNKSYKSSVRFIQGLCSSDARLYEQWLSLGIDILDFAETIKDDNRVNYNKKTYTRLYRKPSDYSKQALNFIKNNFTIISKQILDKIKYFDERNINFDLIQQLLKITKHPKYNDYFKITKKDYNYLTHEYETFEYNIFEFDYNMSFSDLQMLSVILECITDYNLDIKTFLDYCIKLYNTEGLSINDMFQTRHYRDYLETELRLKNHKLSKVNKYPKNFLTEFHKTKTEFKAKKQELDKKEFKRQCNKYKKLKYNDKNFSIVIPNSTQDIEKEADELKHCVRLYIPKVCKGETFICFLRQNDNLDTPLVTLEVKNGYLMQAYGLNDSKPSEEALMFLRKWANKKDLKLAWAWGR